jgi:Glycosyltransferase
MDGLEWKRTKFSKPVQIFLKFAERLAIKFSEYLIADSKGIQSYLVEEYKRTSIYIPYGADLFSNPQQSIIEKYSLQPYSYCMIIARLEPENNVETILDGAILHNLKTPFLIIGRHHTKYGEYLKNKYKQYTQIRFLGGIYDINILNNLRYFSNLYFHGHSVGGTNPSLLEAMASQALICAHNNIFNRSILGTDAFYFETTEDIKIILLSIQKKNNYDKIEQNKLKILELYSWNKIIDEYNNLFEEAVNKIK